MAWRSELWKLGMVLFLALAARAPGQEGRPSFGMSLVGGEAAMGMAIGRASLDRYADLLGFGEHPRIRPIRPRGRPALHSNVSPMCPVQSVTHVPG